MTDDDRPYQERRGEYADRKFGEIRKPKAPQEYGDQLEIVTIDATATTPARDVEMVTPGWAVEFEENVAPGLKRSRSLPPVSRGYANQKG